MFHTAIWLSFAGCPNPYLSGVGLPDWAPEQARKHPNETRHASFPGLRSWMDIVHRAIARDLPALDGIVMVVGM